MRIAHSWIVSGLGVWAVAACSGDASDATGGGGNSGSAAHTGGTAGSNAVSSGGKSGGSGSSPVGTAGSHDGGSTAGGGTSTHDGGAAGAAVTGSAGAAGSGGDGGSAGDTGSAGASDCSAARVTLLGANDVASTREVKVVSSNAQVTTLYIDATAGGSAQSATNPWIFVSLANNAKVELGDSASLTSLAWDLALKRPILYTNDGDGGPGIGGALLIAKDFESVTKADATSAAFATERFFDTACTPNLDPAGAVLTTLSSWYDYDSSTHALSPAAGTWLVRGATGSLFKLRIRTYYGTPEGGIGTAGGAYLMEVGAL